MRQNISAKYIFDGNKLHHNSILEIDNDRIIAIKPNLNNSNLDYPDILFSVGFTDLQINGCGGVLFNDDISHKTLEIMHQANLQSYTTSFLPTLITDDLSAIPLALEVVSSWIDKYGISRGVVGIHLEGPFISDDKSGIHPKKFITKINTDIVNLIISYASKIRIILTLAAECVDSQYIRQLTNAGVIVSIGHSNASYAETISAINSGANSVTHLYNAMSGFSGRNPGVIGACFDSDIYAGIIVDLVHVDPVAIRIAYKILQDKLYLVTDAVTPTGSNLLEFDFAGKHLYVRDGKCVDENGTLGGAYLTMYGAVKNCVNTVGLSLEQVLRMAITTPNKLISRPVDIIGHNFADIMQIKL